MAIVLPAGLRGRLVALVLLAVVPAFGLIVYNAVEQRTAVALNARNDTLALAQLVAAEQGRIIASTHQQLRSLTQLPIVRRPAWHELCAQTLAQVLKQHAQYINVGVIDPSGDVRCSAVPSNQRVNLGDRPYIRRTFETRDFASSYQIGRITGKPTLSIAYPIIDDTGQVEGAVFIALNLVVLFDDLIRTVSLPEGTTLTILNSEGAILARHPDAPAWVGKSLPETELVRTIVAQREGTAELAGLDGVEKFYAFLPLRVVPDINAYISVGIPREIMFAPVNSALARSLAWLAVIATLAGAAAWFGARTLVLRPVSALMTAVTRLGRGDLSARTGLAHDSGELGQLAYRFDEMADALEGSQTLLYLTEAERRIGAARFENIVNAAADAIISIDAGQRVVLFNPSAEQIFGYRANEVLGQPLDLLLPVRFCEAHRRHVQGFGHAPETGRHMGEREELTGRRKDGAEFPVEATISKVAADGQSVYTAILRDITARKRAEQAIREKDRLLTTVGTMAKVGGWEFDARTRKGIWTEEVARIHDMDPKDETTVEIGLRFFQGESRKKIEAAIKGAMENARPYDLELEMTTAKGNHKWVRTIGQPVKEGDAVVKIWGSFQDITERKHAENQIRQLNMDLEERVRQRTAELEVANKELESFSYSVSHDLRAPLRGIDGFSQALMEDYADKLGDQGKGYLQRVRAASQRMAELIDDMLKLARVTRAPMQHEPVDLSTLAHSIVAELQRTQPHRSADVAIEPGLNASGDPRLLRVLLDNLLVNAWKFTGKQLHPKIEFGAHHNNGTLVYFVRDNGAGFDMKYAHKLFGAFQRLHTIAEFPGTGIGLATVQRIVHRHGGRAWAEGTEGHGATFFFTLSPEPAQTPA